MHVHKTAKNMQYPGSYLKSTVMVYAKPEAAESTIHNDSYVIG